MELLRAAAERNGVAEDKSPTGHGCNSIFPNAALEEHLETAGLACRTCRSRSGCAVYLDRSYIRKVIQCPHHCVKITLMGFCDCFLGMRFLENT